MYFLLQGCNVPEISLLNFKKPMRLFLPSNNAKGNKIHFIILNNENNDKLRFRGRMLLSRDFLGRSHYTMAAIDLCVDILQFTRCRRWFLLLFDKFLPCTGIVEQKLISVARGHTVCGASLARAEMLRMPQDQIKTQVWILWGGKIIGRSLSSHL